ncbi:MAG TPA: hypothetical protein VMT30_05935 [Candidatus Saccharimonadia bacterium]|nr:hypothetical protein [Candidatus Saccharimonadia bacterium]
MTAKATPISMPAWLGALQGEARRAATLNRHILAGHVASTTFSRELVRALALVPDPGSFNPVEAKQAVTLLGLLGAGALRHDQERRDTFDQDPGWLLDIMRVGNGSYTFREYLGAVADRTGTGHTDRDTFASLVRWNVPTATVRWEGQPVLELPGVFGDNSTRTYTDDPNDPGAPNPSEVAFFELLKLCEALEAYANQQLMQLVSGKLTPASPEGLEAAYRTATMLDGIRALMAAYMRLKGKRALKPRHFMDVVRQFAPHWSQGDIPTTGAQDPESMKRVKILGIAYPGYNHGIVRLFPSLLEHERAEIEALLNNQPLLDVLLEATGVSLAELAHYTPAQKHAFLSDHPEIAAGCQIMVADGRLALVHNQLTQTYLFNPQRQREADEDIRAAAEGRPPVSIDARVVSNYSGTSKMLEPHLTALAMARQDPTGLLRALGMSVAAISTAAGVRPYPNTNKSYASLVTLGD